ncbi:hypothetical protein [Coleofasciculus sp.]|uniref:hypothetical protein n=1 Tax=Coleofasciculus sp. TaxID=3100458 RepID=UPI004063415A
MQHTFGLSFRKNALSKFTDKGVINSIPVLRISSNLAKQRTRGVSQEMNGLYFLSSHLQQGDGIVQQNLEW